MIAMFFMWPIYKKAVSLGLPQPLIIVVMLVMALLSSKVTSFAWQIIRQEVEKRIRKGSLRPTGAMAPAQNH